MYIQPEGWLLYLGFMQIIIIIILPLSAAQTSPLQLSHWLRAVEYLGCYPRAQYLGYQSV